MEIMTLFGSVSQWLGCGSSCLLSSGWLNPYDVISPGCKENDVITNYHSSPLVNMSLKLLKTNASVPSEHMQVQTSVRVMIENV